MNTQTTASIRCARALAALLLLAPLAGCALWSGDEAGSKPLPSDRTLPGEEAPGQVIDPNVQRPKVGVREIKGEDYEVGAYAGMFLPNRKQTLGIYGLRAAYHKSEKFFVEANYATASTVGYDEFRSLVGANDAPDVDYDSFGLSLGYNLLPGDLYVSKNYTLPITVYAIAGIGYASYESNNFTAYSFGGGLKLFPLDWLSARFELRDQIWSNHGLDDNIEFTFGLAAFF